MSTVGTPDIEPTPEIGSIPSVGNTTGSSFSKKKKRLASDVIGQLEDDLKENDLSITIWLKLISKIESKDKIEKVREIYEMFLKKFPFRAPQWISYINYELNRGEFDKVENLFRRCVYNLSNVQLWSTYVGYIRRKNNLITGGEEARRVIFQVYDLAINKVGIDPESGYLWEEYLNFIESWKPISKWDEQQKMDIKRKIFRKALVIPLNNIEKLWGLYTSFENELNTTTARKFIGEISGQYMTARSWYKEWSNLTRGLVRDVLNEHGEVSESHIPEKEEYDSKQLKLWRDWIIWEASNKLELDQNQLLERIDYVYKQSIQQLIFYPEIWFEFAEFYKQNEEFFSGLKLEELLNESLLVNPTSFLLNFKLVEIYELQNNSVLVEKIYNKLIENLTQNFNFKDSMLEEIKSRLIEDATHERNNKVKIEQNGTDDEGDEDHDTESKPLSEEEKQYVLERSKDVSKLTKELKQLSKIITLSYCHYMKCIKRLKGFSDSRKIFSLCRKSKKTLNHHIFVESAYLEFSNGQKQTALKVFELGLKPNFFGNDGEYVFKYLKFLININDDTNSRSLFETTITTKRDKVDKKWLKRIFQIFLNYEANFGQLSSVVKLENKFIEIFPEESKILLFADRYHTPEDLRIEQDVEDSDDLIRITDLSKSELVHRDTTKLKRKLYADQGQGESQNQEVESDLDDGDHHQQSKKPKLDSELDNDDSVPERVKKQFVSDEVYNLLRVLPNSSYFRDGLFNHAKLIELLKTLQT